MLDYSKYSSVLYYMGSKCLYILLTMFTETRYVFEIENKNHENNFVFFFCFQKEKLINNVCIINAA